MVSKFSKGMMGGAASVLLAAFMTKLAGIEPSPYIGPIGVMCAALLFEVVGLITQRSLPRPRKKGAK